MWRADVANRRHRDRHEILARHDNAPQRDIALAGNGTWRWSDPDGASAREVGAYFWSRRDVGDG